MTSAPNLRVGTLLAALISQALLLVSCTTATAPTATDLSGTWENGPGLDTTTFYIRRVAPDHYAIDWQTDGCLGGYSGSTTAVVSSGTLVLSTPVILYSDDAVRSYVVALSGHSLRLIPDAIALDPAYVRLQTLRAARGRAASGRPSRP